MAISASESQIVRDLVLSRSGIVLDIGKEYLIDARLGALAKINGLPSISALLAKLRQPDGKKMERDIVDAMTTNETSFFRDINPFEAVKKVVLPDLLAQRASERRLSIWCAASSTGQEPYSLVMTMREAFPQLANWHFTFIASDLSRDVLQRAKAGRYSQLEINRGLPASLLVKYFKKVGLEWEINPDLRSMIDFREINLLEPWPTMPVLDLVFIRNVLIYFNNETKKKILGRIRGLMQPAGYLFLGGAETTLNIDDNFERMQADKSGCYRLRSKAAVAA
jgi:chemotaxis protein methyltransferase CheR